LLLLSAIGSQKNKASNSAEDGQACGRRSRALGQYGFALNNLKRVAAHENFAELLALGRSTAAAGQALKTLFEGDPNGLSQGFAGLFGEFTNEKVCAVVLDVNGREKLEGEF
jgi:hypothetical protein